MRTPTLTASAFASLVILNSFVAASLAQAQKISPPNVPDAIRRRTDEVVALLAHASGSQIYTCQPGADGRFNWTLKAPDAELKDQNDKVIGSHFAGPAWKLKDGSAVTGKAAAHADSDDPHSIPWLLVDVVDHSGKGLLTNVTTIQRVNTHGGKAPADGCDEPHRGAEVKSSYTADYYFYAPAK